MASSRYEKAEANLPSPNPEPEPRARTLALALLTFTRRPAPASTTTSSSSTLRSSRATRAVKSAPARSPVGPLAARPRPARLPESALSTLARREAAAAAPWCLPPRSPTPPPLAVQVGGLPWLRPRPHRPEGCSGGRAPRHHRCGLGEARAEGAVQRRRQRGARVSVAVRGSGGAHQLAGRGDRGRPVRQGAARGGHPRGDHQELVERPAGHLRRGDREEHGQDNTVKSAPPWQRPISAPAPPQGALGGSGQLGTPRKRPAHWAPSRGLGGCSS